MGSASPPRPPVTEQEAMVVSNRRFRLDTGRNFCTEKVIKPWNGLPGRRWSHRRWRGLSVPCMADTAVPGHRLGPVTSEVFPN